MIINFIYRAYYRIYYLMFAIPLISHPLAILIPQKVIYCTPVIDSDCRQHQNFLKAKVKGYKWTFWRRSFAFRVIGSKDWFILPKLTPWKTERDGTTIFGLNHTFCRKWAGKNLEFITWV